MVAISLYRGNLHKVPDVPRQWLMPTPTISLKDFKVLLHRRSKALARIQSTTSAPTPTPTPTPTPNPNPNPNINHQLENNQDQNPDQEQTENQNREDDSKFDSDQVVQLDPPAKVDDRKESDGGGLPVTPSDGLEVAVGVQTVVPEINTNLGDQIRNSADEITGIALNPSSETSTKEERKKEVEEKLKILNERKHDLVQVLKQILNAEEELKRRSSMQGLAVRPPVSLHVDVTNDSGSVTRHLTPRMGSDGNLRCDVEGGEADDASNQNMHSRNLLRMSSVSPSSEPLHKRPFHSAVPHASRVTAGASASPSRFAPTGQQGNPASLPTVSVSGTNYIASSPSPAASGGTSVFRDGRHPSPWN